MLAERLGFSGVIATVVAGLYFGVHFPEKASSKTRVNAKASWDTLILLFNAAIFALLGFEFPIIMKTLDPLSLTALTFCSFIIAFVVVATRIVWIFPATYLPRIIFRYIQQREGTPSFKSYFILGWSGMRGIVSLAAALAMPLNIQGHPYLHADIIIFITYVVVVTTLIIPALTLAPLVRYAH